MSAGQDRLADFDSGAWTEPEPPPPPPRLAGHTIALGVWAAAALVLGALPDAADQAPPAEAFLLSRALSRAAVSVRDGASQRPCTWHPGDRRFVCGDAPWAFVGPLAGFANGQPLRCVWVHPQPNGGNITLTLRDQPLGDRIEARLALLSEVGAGADVTLRVLADGVEVGTATSADGRTIATFDKPVVAGAVRGDLTVEVLAREHFWRHACIEVLMTGRRSAVPATGGGTHG